MDRIEGSDLEAQFLAEGRQQWISAEADGTPVTVTVTVTVTNDPRR